MKILQCIYDCIPDAGSEPGIGWQYAMLAAREHEVWALTQSRHREVIEANPHAGKVHWEFVDVPLLPGRLRDAGSISDLAHCLRWFGPMMERARALHADHHFDLTHYVSLAAPWIPEPLFELGLPHVCGPLTSATGGPPILADALGRSAHRDARLRHLLQRSLETAPRSRRKIHSERTLCVATNPGIANRLAERGAANVLLYRLPFALSRAQIEILDGYPRPEPDAPYRCCVSGRMIPWKGHALAIEGFAQVAAKHHDAELHVMGWGPEEPRLRSLVTRLGLERNVVFHGAVPRETERRIMASCHVFVLPSIRDAGATLNVHAMAMDRPIVAYDTPNVARMTGGASLLVLPRRPQDAAKALGEGMLELADDPERRALMGRIGREQVATLFSSDVMQADLASWYRIASGDPARASDRPGDGDTAPRLHPAA